jgi:hypothetical protein
LLNFAALRGPGSFNPRNDGPLITGGALSEVSDTSVAARDGIGFSGARADRAAEGSDVEDSTAGPDATGDGMTDTGASDPVAGARSVAETGAGAGNSEPPHIPQKRFESEFSLPQRGQRTCPPRSSL